MKHDLEQSSYILTNLLDNPCLYGSPSIDMLSFTIPFSQKMPQNRYTVFNRSERRIGSIS